MPQVELTQGYFTIVDEDDFELVSKYNWYVIFSNNKLPYAMNRNLGLMHRFIMKIYSPAIEVDHENHNTLDNRKQNLRPGSKSQNQRNRLPNKGVTYKGVDIHRGKYRARIFVNGKSIHIGYFNSSSLAAKAYDKYAKIYFKDRAYLNFRESEGALSL